MLDMCGIGGVFGFRGSKLDVADAINSMKLAVYLQARGEDAYGFYDGEKVVKFPSAAKQVIDMIDRIKPFTDIVEGKRMFLMHTRLATVGEPTNNVNNHPFESKDFVMAHNGSIYYYTRFVKKGQRYVNVKGGKRWDDIYRDAYVIEEIDCDEIFGEDDADIPETDSFELLVRMQENYNSEKDAVVAFYNAIDMLYGSGIYAVWVYSKAEDKLMLYRDDNPLYIAYKDDKLWFASEDWMLRKLGLNKVKMLQDRAVVVFTKDGIDEVLKLNVKGSKKNNNNGRVVYRYVPEGFCEEIGDYCKDYDACKEFYYENGITMCDVMFTKGKDYKKEGKKEENKDKEEDLSWFYGW